MTGGFLDMGGDRRVAPASAVSMADGDCRINISSGRYWDAPVLPEDRDRYISDAQNRKRISQAFTTSRERAAAAGQADADAKGESSDRAGAPTGRTAASGPEQAAQLVSFNTLRNADAFGAQDARLGYFVDAWINVTDNRAPYVEITPTYQPFRTNFDRRYAIPAGKVEQRDTYGYEVGVTAEELDQADFVSETEGVQMLKDGRFGNAVLRVTVAQK